LTREDAEAALAALVAFDFEGRVAIRQADKGVQATLSWAQQGADARLRLSGPFGAGAVRVALAEGELSIEDNQGVRLVGADAEQALALQLGFSPPIATLRWWLLGLPAPGSAAQVQRDEAGRLVQLMQDGWQVDYLAWRDESLAGGRVAMPRSLRATRGALDLRLVIDRWNLGP
jgi:outer membrane lipoprotein LolB